MSTAANSRTTTCQSHASNHSRNGTAEALDTNESSETGQGKIRPMTAKRARCQSSPGARSIWREKETIEKNLHLTSWNSTPCGHQSLFVWLASWHFRISSGITFEMVTTFTPYFFAILPLCFFLSLLLPPYCGTCIPLRCLVISRKDPDFALAPDFMWTTSDSATLWNSAGSATTQRSSALTHSRFLENCDTCLQMWPRICFDLNLSFVLFSLEHPFTDDKYADTKGS